MRKIFENQKINQETMHTIRERVCRVSKNHRRLEKIEKTSKMKDIDVESILEKIFHYVRQE